VSIKTPWIDEIFRYFQFSLDTITQRCRRLDQEGNYGTERGDGACGKVSPMEFLSCCSLTLPKPAASSTKDDKAE